VGAHGVEERVEARARHAVRDAVEGEEHPRKRASEAQGGGVAEVALQPRAGGGRGLVAARREGLDHGRSVVDAHHAVPAVTQGQGDAARAHAEL
jgi:hypothetical protein